MTTFDANGKMTSCFMPPRDEDGNVLWGGDDPDLEGDASTEERQRRMDTIARAKAGLSPLVPPEDVTYDDEPDDAVRIPIPYARTLPGGGCSNWIGMTREQIDASRARWNAQQRAEQAWLDSIAHEPIESVSAEPPVGFSTPRRPT
jgi:hypothetical protein